MPNTTKIPHRIDRTKKVDPKDVVGALESLRDEVAQKFNGAMKFIEDSGFGSQNSKVTNVTNISSSSSSGGGGGSSTTINNIKVAASDLSAVYPNIKQIDFNVSSFVLSLISSTEVRVDPLWRSASILYATIGSKTVTFNLNGVASPLPGTTYSLIAVATLANGSMSFASVSARTASSFTVQIYQANTTIDYKATYTT